MDSYDTFDGSKPNLVNTRIMRDINAKLNISDSINEKGNVINGLSSFYENYVSPNLFPLIVISLLIIYLLIKYVLKKDREEMEKSEEIKNTVKQHMIKSDNINDIDNTDSENINRLKSSISDMISDDYLLTDDDENDDDENMDDALKMVIDRGSPMDIDKATKIIFGQV